MEEQDKRVEPHASSNGTGNGSAEITQVGQVIRAPAVAATQQLPAAPRLPAPNAALRDRVVTLVASLGDPTHPLHQQAVQDLVSIGDGAVPALNEALNPRRPWLTAYRAAEALGQIGDGRATGPLIEALRHPNSNVRWSAVRALAALSDARALLDLRRVAREDRSKTSWGEPVAGAAQSALDQMRTQNVLLRGADLVKTAVACVAMLVALVLAWSVVTTLRAELDRLGRDLVPAAVTAPQPRTEPTVAATSESLASAPEPTAEPLATATPAPPIAGTVLTTANVRALPSRDQGTRIGTISVGDEIIFLATTPDREWYRVRLGERRSSGSLIDSPDSTGWVIGTLLSIPEGQVPIEDPAQTGTTPAPTPGT